MGSRTSPHYLFKSAELIAESDEGFARIRDIEWEEVKSIPIDGELVGFSPDGRWLAVVQVMSRIPGPIVIGGLNTGDYRLDIIDVASNTVSRSFRHDASIEQVTFSYDGNLVSATGSDGVVKVWDITRRREVARVEPQNGARYLGLTKQSTALVLAEGDEIVFSPLGAENLIAEICRRSVRNLTEAEWRKYLEGEVPKPTCPDLRLESPAG